MRIGWDLPCRAVFAFQLTLAASQHATSQLATCREHGFAGCQMSTRDAIVQEGREWAHDTTALRVGYQCKECLTAAFFNGSPRTSDEDIKDYVERLRHEVEMVHQWLGDNCPSRHVDLAIPEQRLAHTGSLLPRICCKQGCSARATLFVGFLFRQRKDGPAAQTVMDIPICQLHAACPVATFLTDNVWRQVMAVFDERGAARPNRRLTETFFVPIDEAPDQFRSKYES